MFRCLCNVDERIGDYVLVEDHWLRVAGPLAFCIGQRCNECTDRSDDISLFTLEKVGIDILNPDDVCPGIFGISAYAISCTRPVEVRANSG